MKEHVFTLVLLAIGLGMVYHSCTLEVGFLYEPIGPTRFPLLIGLGLILLAGGNLWTLRQSHSLPRRHANHRLVPLLLCVVFYLATFRFFGFMLATTVSMYFTARLSGSSWMQGALTGLLLSIGFYGLFHFMLDVPLPLGHIFGAEQ